jgi:hypothetical protein
VKISVSGRLAGSPPRSTRIRPIVGRRFRSRVEQLERLELVDQVVQLGAATDPTDRIGLSTARPTVRILRKPQ